jgi:hypothetical protein
MHFQKDTENVKRWAGQNGKSLQAELKVILEEQARLGNKAEARALAARIRDRIAARPQTDSGILQAEDRQYLACGRLDTRGRLA